MSPRDVRIIVAEDDAVVARDIRETVEELGYQVLDVVGSGSDAVRTARSLRPDLALLDIRMPGEIDGIGAGREIIHTLGIPVVFLTAYGDRGTMDRAMAEGPFAYILKPFNRQALRAAIEVALHRGELERKLRASEERFASTLRSVGEGVVATDAAGRVNFVNPEAERLTGWPLDEAIGRDVEEVVRFEPEEDEDDDPRHLIRRVLADRTTYTTARLRLLDRGGAATVVSDSVAPVLTLSGDLIGAVAVVRDETETIARARALEETETRFRQIAESMSDVFWLSTVDKTGIEYVSPAFEAIWGHPPEELLNDPELWHRVIVPEDREGLLGALEQQQMGGWEQEYRIRRPDGEIRWIRDRAFPVTDGTGRVNRIAGVAQDITNRRLAEERFGLLSEHIRDVVLVLDRQGRVKFTSKSVIETTGYPAEGLTGTDILEIVHPDDRYLLRQQLDQLAEVGDVTAWTDCRIVTRDGEIRHFESIASNRLDHPGIAGIVMVSRDVTERLALEDQLRKATKMEAIGRLAGGVAHDFNNLLTVIRTQADLLLLDLDPPPQVREEIELIASTAGRAAELTTQLLAFGRGQVLRPQIVNINDVLNSMMRLLARTVGEQVRIETSLASSLKAIKIDRGQLEQVVMNLALNARDAMPRGGTLRFTTRMKENWPHPGTTVVRLLVADDGIGMDAATQERVFEPFFTTKAHRGGTGLGLASCYGIVQQSGGTLEVRSHPGKGTTFVLDFPPTDAEPSTESGPTPDARTSVGRSSLELLLVEDDAGVRRAVERTLTRSAYRVSSVDEIDAAIGIVDREPDRWGAILTDLAVGGESARTLIDHLLSRHPEIPIIAMSGYTEGSPGTRRGLPPEIHFVKKPFTPEGLIQEVRRVIRSE